MPNHPADSLQEALPDLYRKMEELMRQQVELLTDHPDEPDESRIEALIRLSGEWQEYARQLTDRRDELDRMPESQRMAVAGALQRMEEYGKRLESALRHRMDTLTWSLKALHHHATARRAYGGYGNQDVIPMYFDERQ